ETVFTYTATPLALTCDTAGGTGSVTVSAGGSCAWSSSTTSAWITITSGASGTGNGTVAFTVAANTGGARTATVVIAGNNVTVTRSAWSRRGNARRNVLA